MNLANIVPAVLRAAPVILLAAAAAFVTAFGLALLRGADYEATAVVDVKQVLAQPDAFSNSERADRAVANELILAQSMSVARAASERLGGVDAEELRGTVAVDQVIGTDNLGFAATAADPAQAARTATEYATAYVAARLGSQRAALTAEADALAGEMQVLQDQLAALPPLENAQERAQWDALQQQYVALADRETDLRSQARAEQAPAGFVAPAPEPGSAAGYGPLVWAALAGLLTLGLGVLAVAVLSVFRDPVEHGSDVDELDLPVLGEAEEASWLWGSRRSLQGLEAAALDIITRDPVPSVVAVLSVDRRNTADVLDALAHQVRRHGRRLGDHQVTVVGGTAPAADALSRSLARKADLLVLVIVRGSTRRAAVARTVARLDRVTQAPRAALLVDAAAFERRGAEARGRHVDARSSWRPSLRALRLRAAMRRN